MSRDLEFEIFENKFTVLLLTSIKFLKISLMVTTFYTFNKKETYQRCTISFIVESQEQLLYKMSRNLEFEIFESKFTTSLLKFLKISLTVTTIFYTFNKTRRTNVAKSGNLIEYFTPKKKKRNQRPN